MVLPINAKVRDALRLFRREIPRHTDMIFWNSRSGHFSRSIPLAKLHSLPEHLPLADVSLDDFPIINATEEGQLVAKEVLLSGFGTLPVVNENQKLISRIDVTAATELMQ